MYQAYPNSRSPSPTGQDGFVWTLEWAWSGRPVPTGAQSAVHSSQRADSRGHRDHYRQSFAQAETRQDRASMPLTTRNLSMATRLVPAPVQAQAPVPVRTPAPASTRASRRVLAPALVDSSSSDSSPDRRLSARLSRSRRTARRRPSQVGQTRTPRFNSCRLRADPDDTVSETSSVDANANAEVETGTEIETANTEQISQLVPAAQVESESTESAIEALASFSRQDSGVEQRGIGMSHQQTGGWTWPTE